MNVGLDHQRTRETPVAAPAAPSPASPARTGRFGLPVGAALAMMLLTLLASGVNYASNLVFSRVLEPAQFGDLTALLALTVIAAVPSGAAQTVLADRLAAHSAAGAPMKVAYLIRHAVAHVGLYVLILGLLFLAATPVLDDVMNLQSPTTLMALTPMLLLSFFTPLAFGILQGLERFVALGLVMLWIAVSRIAFGVPWALSDFGGGPGGALLGMAFGNAMALVATAWVVRAHLLRRGTGAATAGVRRRMDTVALAAGGAFIGFAFLSNFDVILAKLVLSAHDSGQYAALATVGKIIFFLPGAVALLMVPRAARARIESGSAQRVLRTSALAVAAATLLVAVPAALAPEFVVRTMFGSDYVETADGVLPMVVAGAGLALVNLLVVYTVAIKDRRWVGLLLGGVCLQVVMILVLDGSATQVAVAQAVTVWAVLILNELLFHPLVRASRLTRTPAA